MQDKNLSMPEENMEETKENEELFEEVEEAVTASWTGCADCCN